MRTVAETAEALYVRLAGGAEGVLDPRNAEDSIERARPQFRLLAKACIAFAEEFHMAMADNNGRQ